MLINIRWNMTMPLRKQRVLQKEVIRVMAAWLQHNLCRPVWNVATAAIILMVHWRSCTRRKTLNIVITHMSRCLMLCSCKCNTPASQNLLRSIHFISKRLNARDVLITICVSRRYKSIGFYPNVTTLRSGKSRSGTCYRKSGCRLSSVCCL